MSTVLEHFIITRFNLALFGQDKFGKPVLDDQWWEHRIALFSRFTIPSLQAQSNPSFKWLILIGQDTPLQWYNALRQETKALGDQVLLMRCSNANAWIPEFNQQVAKKTTHVLTTRIDNDDAFAVNAVALIQDLATFFIAADSRSERFVINLSHGWCWNGKNAFSLDTQSNSFTTMVESRHTGGHSTPMITIYSANHSRLFKQHNYIDIKTATPQWLQVIHKRNVANNVLGTQIDQDATELLVDRFAIADLSIPEHSGDRPKSKHWVDYTPDRLRHEHSLGNVYISPSVHENVASAVSIDDDGIRLVPNLNREVYFQTNNQRYDGQSVLYATCTNPHASAPNVYFRFDLLKQDSLLFSKNVVLSGQRTEEIVSPLPQPLHGNYSLRVAAGIQAGETTARYAWPKLISLSLS